MPSAASPSQIDVAAALALCVDGDTLLIPAGTAIWTSTLVVNKAVTIQGDGITTGNPDIGYTWAGGTTIMDGVPNAAGDHPILQVQLVSGKQTRISGLKFMPGAPTQTHYNGITQVAGLNNCNNNAARLVWDNCDFGAVHGVAIFTSNVLGVISKCVFNPGGNIPIYIYHENWGGAPYSDGSWHDSVAFGTEKFLFIEDCNLEYPAGITYATTDAYRGARYVIRKCRVNRAWVEMHGSDSGGRARGTRAVELYDCVFDGTGATTNYVLNIRSGTAVITGNRVQNFSGWTPKVNAGNYRHHFPFAPWGEADGSSPWDVNDPSSPFLTGTATGGGAQTMTDSTKTWTVDQWAGYSIRNTSISNALGYNGSYISSNTSNTITFEGDGGYAAQVPIATLAFTAGQGYQINKVTEVFDGCGRGQGTQLSGTTPSVPGGWNDQVTEPIYMWGNTELNSAALVFLTSYPSTIRNGEHYIVGTPKPGWSRYTYPHPLTGGGAPPSTNSNLAGLAISSGTLAPSFNSGVLSYTASVGNVVTSVTVSPLTADSTATVTVNGAPVTSGSASGAIVLAVGTNTITTVCTAQDGTSATTYVITLTRATAAGTNADLASLVPGVGSLSPVFASGTTSYTIGPLINHWGPPGPPSFTFVPVLSDAAATMTVNGFPCLSGDHSERFYPLVGDNIYTISVTAADGTTVKNYVVTLTRSAAAGTDASLSSLVPSTGGGLSPVFDSGTLGYVMGVVNGVTAIAFTPTSTDPLATILVGGSPCINGAVSTFQPLSVGSNNVLIAVTAQDGVTIDAYVVTVVRGVVNTTFLPFIQLP